MLHNTQVRSDSAGLCMTFSRVTPTPQTFGSGHLQFLSIICFLSITKFVKAQQGQHIFVYRFEHWLSPLNHVYSQTMGQSPWESVQHTMWLSMPSQPANPTCAHQLCSQMPKSPTWRFVFHAVCVADVERQPSEEVPDVCHNPFGTIILSNPCISALSSCHCNAT